MSCCVVEVTLVTLTCCMSSAAFNHFLCASVVPYSSYGSLDTSTTKATGIHRRSATIHRYQQAVLRPPPAAFARSIISPSRPNGHNPQQIQNEIRRMTCSSNASRVQVFTNTNNEQILSTVEWHDDMLNRG